MLGIHPDRLLTNKIADELGLAPDSISVKGEIPVIKNFRFPKIIPIIFGPKRLHGLMRRHLVQRPVRDDELCRMCGECWKYCPAGAITPKGKRLHFDYDKCIRCYCCIEMCPLGALRAKETLQGKVLRKAIGLRRKT